MFSLTVLTGGFSDFLQDLDREFQISDLFRLIKDFLFGVKVGQYRHIPIGNMAPERIGTVVLCATVAIILASFWLSHVRSKQGRFVRALLNSDAMTKDSAKTLSELGFFRDQEVRRSLSSGNELHIVVKCVEEEAFLADRGQGRESDPESPLNRKKRGNLFRFASYGKPKGKNDFRLDFTQAHFYVPEEMKYVAENRFSTDGFGTPKLVLISVATLILAVAFCRLIDPVLSLADAILTLLE